MTQASATRITRERGGIVTGWLLRLTISLLALGFVFFEAGAVVVARVGVDGTAQTASREAALVYGSSHDAQQARSTADKNAAQGGARVTQFQISQDGKTVTVTLERTAKTVLIQHIGPLEKYRTVRATSASPVR